MEQFVLLWWKEYLTSSEPGRPQQEQKKAQQVGTCGSGSGEGVARGRDAVKDHLLLSQVPEGGARLRPSEHLDSSISLLPHFSAPPEAEAAEVS